MAYQIVEVAGIADTVIKIKLDLKIKKFNHKIQIEFMRFMIEQLEGNILAKKKEMLNMDKDVIYSPEMVAIMKDNGEIIKWMEKDKHTIVRINFNTLANGKLTNIMDGASYIQILI